MVAKLGLFQVLLELGAVLPELHSTCFVDFGYEGGRVAQGKFFHALQVINEDFGHSLSVEITGGEDEDLSIRLGDRLNLCQVLADANVFGKDEPAPIADDGQPFDIW